MFTFIFDTIGFILPIVAILVLIVLMPAILRLRPTRHT